MKNNQPQLHVTSTLIAQESITLNVISMNTGRIHTPWLVLVRGASSAFGRGFGGLNARAADVACAMPVRPASLAAPSAASLQVLQNVSGALYSCRIQHQHCKEQKELQAPV